MRYIIIPLVIILYIWWSYKSIKSLRNNNAKEFAEFWLIVHIVLPAGYLLFKLTEFTINNW